MNTLQLMQRVCAEWLTEKEQTQLSSEDAQSLITAVNSTVRAVWSALPSQYRQKTLSLVFREPATAVVDVSRGFLPALLGSAITNPTNNPAVSTNFDLAFCSVVIDGDTNRNELRFQEGSSADFTTLHPFMGTTGTAKALTIYKDALLLDYHIDRLLTPMVEISSGLQWSEAMPQHRRLNYDLCGNLYSLESVTLNGTNYTLARITPKNATMLAFESMAIFRPQEITLLTSQQASNLPYGDDVGQWIIQACGTALLTHSKLRQEVVQAAMASRASVLRDIAMQISPSLSNTVNEIGPPPGW